MVIREFTRWLRGTRDGWVGRVSDQRLHSRATKHDIALQQETSGAGEVGGCAYVAERHSKNRGGSIMISQVPMAVGWVLTVHRNLSSNIVK